MHRILRLGESLFVDLENGRCSRTRQAATGEPGEKLTHGQLRLLNYLVENREYVCENSKLEGLFDSKLGEEQTAGIKQQIQRIKNKFRSVDSSFDSQRAKTVFQSIPRVGYLFHLPEKGEILESGIPADALLCLDAEWFAGIRKLGEEERKEVRESFDRMDGSWENTLRASALGMCVHTAAMRRQLHDFSEYLFREDGARGVVTVVSVGAEGKTVLLSEFARMCAEEHPNWNVYEMDLSAIEPSPEAMQEIMDYIRQRGIGKLRRCILLMDDPDVLDRRFGYFLHKVQEINQPWLYVVLTSRLYTITLAFKQPWLSDYHDGIRVYLLDPEARAKMPDGLERTIYVRNEDGTKRKVEIDWEKIEVIRAKDRLEVATDLLVAVPPVSVKKEVMAGIVERCYGTWGEVKEALEKRLSELPYEESSYINLYLMLLGHAGRMMGDERQEIMEENACRGDTVWDRWQAVTGILDERCIGYRVISEMFPYMAVMWIFGMYVTIEFLCRATGWENEGGIRWMLDKPVGNEIITGEGKMILPPDRDVLYACFYMHPEISAERCLQEIFQSSWLDEEMLESAISKTFLHFMHKDVKRIPFSIDIGKLAKITLRNRLYTKMLADKGFADIPELAVLWFSYEPGIFQGTLSRTVIAFTVAFERITEEETRGIICAHYWLRFLEVAVYYFENVPDFLMDFFTEQDEGLQEKILAGVENNLKNGRYYRESFWKTHTEHYLQELQHEFDKKPARIRGKRSGERPGAGSPEERERIPEETDLKEPGGNTSSNNNGRPPVKNRLLNALLGKRREMLMHLDMIGAEEQELFDMLDARARGERIGRLTSGEDEDSETEREELSSRANNIFKKYQEFMDAMTEAAEEEGILLVSGRWSMFCYRLGMLEQAHDILACSVRCLHEPLEGMYWTYLMQGRVAEAGGPRSPGEAPVNPYYSLDAAERYYRKAYRNYLRYGNQNDLEPFVAILETLAALYFKQGKTNKEEKIYEELETRIPSSRIRDEVHGCLID